MRISLKLWTALALAVIIALVVAACGGDDETPTATPTATRPPAATTTAPAATPTRPPAAPTPTPAGPKPAYGGVLRSVMLGPAITFDMHATRGGGWHVAMPIFNYLVQNRLPLEQGGALGIGPDLATNWTLSSDSKVYTFRLANGVTWHDGRPLTAADVVFSFNRIASDPSIPTAPFRTTFVNVDKIEAVDPSTVRITLKDVSASFLARLTAIGNVIYPQHALQSVLDFKPIGSGPFKFVSHERDIRTVVTRSTTYFKKDAAGNALPFLDGLELHNITGAAAKLAAFRTGRVDMMDMVTSVVESEYQKIAREVPGTVGYRLNNGWLYWTFQNKPPFDDVRVRKAFHLAMDRQQWDAVMNESQGDPYVLYMDTESRWRVPPDEVKTWPGYRQPKDADIAEAKRLLREAGVDIKSVRLSAGTYPEQATTAAAILRTNLGIETQIEILERGAFTQARTNRTFQILYDSNSAAIDDPSSVFPGWYRSNGNNNPTGFVDATLDQWIDQIESTLDAQARLKLTLDIQRRLTNDLVWTPNHGSLFRRYLYKSSIQGWIPHTSAQDGVPYRHETTWFKS